MTDIGAKGLCAALSFDRRLVLLSLRACLLGPETEGLFVELMRDHLALARVDLRQSLDPAMGILKVWNIKCGGRVPFVCLCLIWASHICSHLLHTPTIIPLQLRKPRPAPVFSTALGFMHEALPEGGAPSPTGTVTSRALWELLSTAGSTAGGSMAAGGRGGGGGGGAVLRASPSGSSLGGLARGGGGSGNGRGHLRRK